MDGVPHGCILPQKSSPQKYGSCVGANDLLDESLEGAGLIPWDGDGVMFPLVIKNESIGHGDKVQQVVSMGTRQTKQKAPPGGGAITTHHINSNA
jgi:hypothetical protein